MRATALALLAGAVVLTGVGLVLPLYSTGHPGGVEVIVKAFGSTIVNKPGDWPAGELSPLYAWPFIVTALALAIAVVLSRKAQLIALGGAAAQVGALGVLVALVVSERGLVAQHEGRSFSFGVGLLLIGLATVAAVVGAVALQREAK